MKEHLIECFIALCKKEGEESIAERTGFNAEGLRQIRRRVKLPSGKPRGVGAKLLDALDEHYPGWSKISFVETSDTDQSVTPPPTWAGVAHLKSRLASNLAPSISWGFIYLTP